MRLHCLLTAVYLLISVSSWAQEDRKSKLDFEGSVVEGINKKPLDSLSQISDRDKGRKKTYLYWKRSDFNDQMAGTLQEVRYNP